MLAEFCHFFFRSFPIVAVQVVLAIISISGLVQGAVPGLNPEKSWDVSGYVTYRTMVSYPENNAHSLDHILHQRLNAEYRLHPNCRLNAGLRNRLIFGDTAKNSRYRSWINEDYGYFDWSSNWLEEKGWVGNSQVDRFNFTWNQKNWQVKGGRQRINWGMATIWNPNDLFNTYSLYEIDYAERPGTDAVLVSYKTGYASGVEVAFSPDEDSEQNSWSGRYFFNARGWDIQLLGGKSGLDHVLGAGFSGNIKGAGFRGELSYFQPDHHYRQGNNLEQTVAATVEAGYSFSGERNWSVKIAWLYFGEPDDEFDTGTFLSQPLSVRTLSFSRNSYYGETGFDLSALLRLIFSGVFYQDNSYYLSLAGQYSLADNWQLHSGMQYFGGTDNSVYGQETNTSIYLLLKYSF
ncbi:hypothetical protein [Vibrio salinus]|uniref:hypothetical protein n=1 Tax=Vibrio salinus TaxID=2899784 RepID=UPI001E61EF34|nr:hypothetical protein [Vibrio salinus]MCE0495827.1 hypothetical protein [Vibrio salinus]